MHIFFKYLHMIAKLQVETFVINVHWSLRITRFASSPKNKYSKRRESRHHKRNNDFTVVGLRLYFFSVDVVRCFIICLTYFQTRKKRRIKLALFYFERKKEGKVMRIIVYSKICILTQTHDDAKRRKSGRRKETSVDFSHSSLSKAFSSAFFSFHFGDCEVKILFFLSLVQIFVLIFI